MQKILTISIAAYNVEKYLRKTLDSLIIDNMDLLEVLIIVDGCKDKTLDIAKEYEKRYPDTFKAIYKENGGYGSTINKGIELATGKYFKQLDGDDWFDTKNLNVICNELNSNETYDIIYTPYIEYYEKNGQQVLKSNKIVEKKYESDLEKVIEKADSLLVMHALMYNTNLLKNNKIHIDEHCFYTDTEYAILPLYYSKKIKIFDLPVYIYRIGISGQSISYESRLKNYNDHVKVNRTLMKKYEECNNVLSKNIKKYIENHMVRQFNGSITNFLLIRRPNKKNYEEIKKFDMEILDLSKNMYQKMADYSKVIKLFRKNNFCSYLICHFIRKYKVKHRWK